MGFEYSVVAALVLLCVADPYQAEDCTFRAVNLCVQPMLQYDLANNAAIVPTHSVETMRAICETYEGVRECLTPIHASCTPDVQAIFTGIDQSYYYICDETFDDYVQYRECLSTPMLHTEGEQCGDNLISSLGSIPTRASQSTITSLACGYATTYITCVHDVVEVYCGSDAADWQEELDIRILGPSLDYIDCPLFDGYLFVWHDVTNTSDGMISVGALVGIILAVLIVLIIVAIGLARYKISRKQATREERPMPVHSVTSSGGPPSHPSVRYEHGGAMIQPYPVSLSAPPPYKEKEALYDDCTPHVTAAAPSVYSEPPPYYEAAGNPTGGPEVVYDNIREPKFAFENMTYSG